jgi:hypothetical protein
MRVGLISDTHGLLRPEALAALAGVSRILHAGDVGSADVLSALSSVAPVEAVRGNVDQEPWAAVLPRDLWVEAGGKTLYLTHEPGRFDLDPRAAGIHVVVFGHTHQPRVAREHGVLFVNPGSAGPRRFSAPVTLALLDLDDGGGRPDAEIVPLLGGSPHHRR